MGIGLKADLEVPAPGNLHMKREVEKAGEELLSDIMHKPSYPYSLASMKREEVVNQDFLNLNAKYCIAYVANAKVVEVYKIFEPHTGYGYIELVNVVTGVKQMPEWRNILVQVSRLIWKACTIAFLALMLHCPSCSSSPRALASQEHGCLLKRACVFIARSCSKPFFHQLH